MLTADKLITMQELLPKDVYIDWFYLSHNRIAIKLIDVKNKCYLDQEIYQNRTNGWNEVEKFIKSLLENGVI